MNVNERIARGLGFDIEAKAEHQWTTLIGDHNIEWCERCCSSVNTCCGGEIADVGPCEPVWPNYEHSLDALLPVLADHPEWFWSVRRRGSGRYDATIESLALDRAWVSPHYDTPSEALALAVADALEASK
jgi:hypothetical protein